MPNVFPTSSGNKDSWIDNLPVGEQKKHWIVKSFFKKDNKANGLATKLHPSLEEARKEARRLSFIFPESYFCVYESQSYFSCEVTSEYAFDDSEELEE